mgnify:CR=1 FL=1
MYGTQTTVSLVVKSGTFENDVKMYGTQTNSNYRLYLSGFENDVKMYGTQTMIGTGNKKQ